MADKKAVEKKTEIKADDRPKNNVRVGSRGTKFLYADLVKHLLSDGEKEVVISAMNFGISDAVSVAEMLKSQGCVKVSKVSTSRGNENGRAADKIEIVVVKAPNFDKIYGDQLRERAEKKAEFEAKK
jgi:DNA-binding protein